MTIVDGGRTYLAVVLVLAFEPLLDLALGKQVDNYANDAVLLSLHLLYCNPL